MKVREFTSRVYSLGFRHHGSKREKNAKDNHKGKAERSLEWLKCLGVEV